MRLHVGEIPDTPEFVPDESWTLLAEPTPWAMQILSVPIGIAAMAVLLVLWMVLTPVGSEPPSVAECVVALIAVVPAHEALHLLVHPRTGDSIVGFWPSRLLFYTLYQNRLTCRRYLTVLLAPIVGLSLAPLAACALAGVSSPFLTVASVANALFASGDLFAVGLLLAQVPTRATLRNKGWGVWWKA